jgi:hypothetical protein
VDLSASNRPFSTLAVQPAVRPQNLKSQKAVQMAVPNMKHAVWLVQNLVVQN